jgi:hypothetical protein
MNHFKYRAYYKYSGPSHSDPFRSKKSDADVALALSRFPNEISQFLLDSESVVTSPSQQPYPNSSHVSVATTLNETATDAAVAKCLNSLDLFAQKVP